MLIEKFRNQSHFHFQQQQKIPRTIFNPGGERPGC